MLKKHAFTILIYTICLILLSTSYIVGTRYNIPFSQITGDPALTFNSHPFTGIISNIGVLAWSSTSCICLFSGIILLKLKQNREAIFLISSGIISFVLLIDDFFMFHDYILYSFKTFKITQSITYTFYILLMLWYTILFIKLILSKTSYIILGLAFIFLGASVLIDFFIDVEANLKYFIEDGFKFVGIFSWMLFYITSSYRLVSKYIK